MGLGVWEKGVTLYYVKEESRDVTRKAVFEMSQERSLEKIEKDKLNRRHSIYKCSEFFTLKGFNILKK